MFIVKRAKTKRMARLTKLSWVFKPSLIGVIMLIACFVIASFSFIIRNNFTLAQTNSSDAIAVRVIQNPDHLSAVQWYKNQGFTGSPQSITVDGYEGVRDGRTVYVDVANIVAGASTNDLYTNIYLISYNQAAERQTTDIFAQILSHWKFNSNIIKGGFCRQSTSTACNLDEDCKLGDFCDSPKARVIRDVRRLADLHDIKQVIDNYHNKSNYPQLNSGTYIPHRTYSVWPSWKDELARNVGTSLAVDPVNKIGDCPGYNADTCWNENTLKFATTPPDLPMNSLLYSYYYYALPTPSYDVCAVFESGMNFKGAQVCAIDVCLDFDHDGYGSPASNKCTYPQLDCNDSDPNIGPSIPGVCGGCTGIVNCSDPNCFTNPACKGNPTCVGDGLLCRPGEDCNNCPADCGPCPTTCPDGVCDASCNECQTCYDPNGTATSHNLQYDCYCGDGVVCTSRGEECDDGLKNGTLGDPCSANCKKVSTCTSDPLCGNTPGLTGCFDSKHRWICEDKGNNCIIRQSYDCLGNDICSAGKCVSPCLTDVNCNPVSPPVGFAPATAVGCGTALPHDWHYIWHCQQGTNSCWTTNWELCPSCPGQTAVCNPNPPVQCTCVPIACTPTCTAVPGCLLTAPANSSLVTGENCCGGNSCYACATGYTWNNSICAQNCTDTCASLGYQCGNQTVCGVAKDCGPCTSGICCGHTCQTPACTSVNDPICNDNNSCTTDVCNNPSSCTAACVHTPITACTNDGCCPSVCTAANDSDCKDITPPTIVITIPTNTGSYSTSTSIITIGGTASDDVGVTNITWTNNGVPGTPINCTSGCTNWNWSINNISLSMGINTIIVTAHDAAGNTGPSSSATIIITRTNPACIFTITFPCTF